MTIKFDNFDEFVNQFYGCYLHVLKDVRKNHNFNFDYEEFLLWEYYLLCKRLYNNDKYKTINHIRNTILKGLYNRLFQKYKRIKNIDIDINYNINSDNTYDIDLFEMMCKNNNIVYDYLYNKLTIREICKKYKI